MSDIEKKLATIPIFSGSLKNNPEGKTTVGRRPGWLKVQSAGGESYSNIRKMMRSKSLHTVCEEAKCPNIAECWSAGTATFMILGDTCTRSCAFCAIKTGRPNTVNPHEPIDIARSIKRMGIKHAVITSVDRDELKDQGSIQWERTILEIKSINPEVTQEVLIPDFNGNRQCLDRIINAQPEVISHNIETVPRIYKRIRPQAKYWQSLDVLEYIKSSGIKTKTGIMVGIGERDEEIIEVMKDLADLNIDVLTIGQYLQPSVHHAPVERFVHPDQFAQWKIIGEQMGIAHVESGPLVRSSYHAEKHV